MAAAKAIHRCLDACLGIFTDLADCDSARQQRLDGVAVSVSAGPTYVIILQNDVICQQQDHMH